MQELTDLGKKAVNFALRKGAEEVEAYLSTSTGTSIDIERGQIVRSAKHIDQGLGLRAVYGKAVGFAYTNTLTHKSIEEVAERAFKAAKASRPDNNWHNFPSQGSYCETTGTYDKRIVAISSDELVETVATMLEATTAYDKRVFAVGGGAGTSVFQSAVVNSCGIEVVDKGTAVGCSMETIARDGADVTPACFEVDAKRVYKIDTE